MNTVQCRAVPPVAAGLPSLIGGHIVASASLIGVLLALPIQTFAAEPDTQALREEMEALKQDYEDRIEAMERQLEAMEADDSAGPVTASPGVGSSEPVSSGTAFNPRISVVLDGFYYDDDIGGTGAELAGEAVTAVGGGGHGHGEEGGEGHGHGAAERGFNLRSAELVFEGTVDPYFDANARLVVDGGGDVELEEAWFRTRSLPAGLQLKAGKFKSDIGYINRQHPHQWDFTDQNLAYLNLLGFEGVTDIGAQFSWVPRLPIFTRFGFELLQGEREELFGSVVEDEAEREELGLGDPRQPRLLTAYAKVAPNIGANSALQLGLSYLRAPDSQQIGEFEAAGGLEGEAGLEGDSDLWIADLVYRYDAGGAYGRGDIKVQTEYLYQDNDFTVTGVDPADPAAPPVGSSVRQKTDGWYVQGLYGFLPRWQVGLRYDVVGPTNKISNGESDSFDDSSRWTAAVTWTPTEFSRFRLQLARADILSREEEELVRNEFDSVYLQYIISLGSHGAHYF